MSLNSQQMAGLKEDHLCSITLSNNRSFSINKQIKKDFSRLIEASKKASVELTIISSFRSFDDQLSIWNDKWHGYRPVYSKQGRPLNTNKMSAIEKYKAIALWSALPGFSRHHWGTDIDIFSLKALEKGYKAELVPEEFYENGVCCELNEWLNKNLEKYGFFRPYAKYSGGVAVEPWHISHHSESGKIEKQFELGAVVEFIEKCNISDKPFILDHLDHYRQQYFLNISKPESTLQKNQVN